MCRDGVTVAPMPNKYVQCSNAVGTLDESTWYRVLSIKHRYKTSEPTIDPLLQNSTLVAVVLCASPSYGADPIQRLDYFTLDMPNPDEDNAKIHYLQLYCMTKHSVALPEIFYGHSP